MEPRISGANALKVVHKLGFSKYFLVDAEGFSGGLWLLWNSNQIKLQVVACSPSTITSLIVYKGIRWFFTAVYASPQAHTRRYLWPYLDSALASYNIPWLFVGDFNETLTGAERRGSTSAPHMTGMRNWTMSNALVDLGYIGPDYTWTRNPHTTEALWERLDRRIGNMMQRTTFPEAFITHLPRLHSDHTPLLLKLHTQMIPRPANKAFRFQTVQYTHSTFDHLVCNFWGTNFKPSGRGFPKFTKRLECDYFWRHLPAEEKIT